MSSQTSTLNRRQLARGAAWSLPIVAASSAIPAYAASPAKCESTGRPFFVGGAKFHWGTLGQRNQRQQLILFSRLQIENVSKNSIASVTVKYVIQQRATGTTSPGAPLATDPSSDFVDGSLYSGAQSGLTTKGASGTLTQTASNETIRFGTATAVYNPASTSGTPYNTYTLTYSLTNFGESYYSQQGQGDCSYVFDTSSGALDSFSNMGSGIEINWTGQEAPRSLSTDSLKITTHWTYTLADGRSYEVVETPLPTQPAANTGYFSANSW